ncbi:MAG: SAM-dependent methyltransferase [Selenomonadaceae bacterium]|nr:SAM-dependent methyltransferase [Selenomonadaceae bacterium]
MIDSRIKAVMNFVRAGGIVADVGADHGYLSIELVKNGLAKKVIATEKNIHPFEALNENILTSGFGDKIEVRLGDGLQILSAGEVDTICIAGMGGSLITKILDDSPEVVKSARQLILQPMNGIKKIRVWLAENNWIIADEDLAEASDIIYEIISAEKNPVPKVFKRETSPLKEKFSVQRLAKLEKVISEMNKSSAVRSSEKFLALQAEIDALRQSFRNEFKRSV